MAATPSAEAVPAESAAAIPSETAAAEAQTPKIEVTVKPQAKPTARSKARASQFSTIKGWRLVAVIILALLAILAVIIAACLIASLSSSGGALTTAVSTPGICGITDAESLGAHFAVNIAATTFLAACNFFMQVLVAPRRRDIDAAHATGRWVEVGCQSLSNLRSVPRANAAVWLLLAATALPLHWIFNGAIFKTMTTAPPGMASGFGGQDQPYCHLEAHNPLLGAAALLCLTQVALCTVALWLTSRSADADRSLRPLVTIGDAIDSFIRNPDSTTLGMCSWGRDDFPWRPIGGDGSWTPPRPPPDWMRRGRRCWAAVPGYVWAWSYAVILLAFGAIAAVLAFSFLPRAAASPSTLTGQLLIANTPQIAIAVNYLSYNGLFTRMFAEREWSSFSVAYSPLRVSHPEGSQRQAYNLHLPYYCSSAMVFVGIVLHWLLSMSAAPTVSRDLVHSTDPSFFIYKYTETSAIQFNLATALSATAFAAVSALIPLIIARFRLPGHAVLAGNSSAAISAACHCVPHFPGDATSTALIATPLAVALSIDEADVTVASTATAAGGRGATATMATTTTTAAAAAAQANNATRLLHGYYCGCQECQSAQPQEARGQRQAAVNTHQLHGYYCTCRECQLEEMEEELREQRREMSQMQAQARAEVKAARRGASATAEVGERGEDGGRTREEEGRTGENVLERMATGKLRWGVVSSMPMRALRFSPMQQAHLAFGCPMQDVRPPEDGEMYA